MFHGTGIAIVTPFTKEGAVDYTALDKLVEYQISNGIDYLVILGTTAEAATLSKEEKRKVIDQILKTNKKRVDLVVGFGGNNTAEVVAQIKEFERFDEINGILSVSPYYNKPSQEGIFQHYKCISEASPVPVIIYNVPGRTGSNIAASTTLRIANELENVIAIKEASGDLVQIMEIIKSKPDDFIVISGDDALTYPMIQLGASGVISVIGNAYPKEWSDMVNYSLEGKNKEALELHYRLLDSVHAIFEEGNPSGVKAILEMKNIISNNLRLPLCKVSKELYEKLSKLNSTI
jgi:4-hydroxy-tetrahydrodipicolinate synthase